MNELLNRRHVLRTAAMAALAASVGACASEEGGPAGPSSTVAPAETCTVPETPQDHLKCVV
jgi:hypothetical protein